MTRSYSLRMEQQFVWLGRERLQQHLADAAMPIAISVQLGLDHQLGHALATVATLRDQLLLAGASASVYAEAHGDRVEQRYDAHHQAAERPVAATADAAAESVRSAD